MGDLAGLTFLSATVTRDEQPYDLVGGSRITLEFTDDAIAANAGCNRMSGNATVSDGVLVVGGSGLATTEMACDPALMDQDTWLAGILTSRPSITLEGDRLTVATGDTMIDLLNRDIGEPDQPLVGTTWVLQSLGAAGDDGSVSSIPDGIQSTLRVEADGRALIKPGCNSGSTVVTITDGTLEFGAIALTRMACPGPESDVEAGVLSVLDSGDVEYAIEGSTLTLTSAGRLLTYAIADKVNPAD
jgi:heat shock protein HslJ